MSYVSFLNMDDLILSVNSIIEVNALYLSIHTKTSKYMIESSIKNCASKCDAYLC